MNSYKKFGYDAIVEKEKIRHRLVESGVADSFDLHFLIESEYIKNHENDVPYRDKKVQTIDRSADFTEEELNYLVEMFGDANNPLAQSIAEKAKTILDFLKK